MHSFKWIKVAGFVGCCVLLTMLLNFSLQQYNIARVNVHRIGTERYDDIFIGTSHGLSAINPEEVDKVTGRKSTNICMPDEHLIDSYFLVKEACRKQNPKRIIYELDPPYWSTRQNNGENSVYIYKEFPVSYVKTEYFWSKIKDMDVRVTLAPWYYYRNRAKDIEATIKVKLSREYEKYMVDPLNTEAQMYTREGYVYQTSNPNVREGSKEIILWNKDEIKNIEKEYFEKLVRFCRRKKIDLVVITTPVSKETLEIYKLVFEEANRYYSRLMEKYEVPYYDFNFIDLKGFDKGINRYLDYEGHMSGELGNDFSERLGKYLIDNS